MQIRQVVVTGQHQVELQTIELDKKILGPNEILIDTTHTFISAGTELANYTGREPKVFEPKSWCAYPWPSGYANVGIVRQVGAAVQRVKAGQRVFSYGGHASVVCYNQERLIVPVPDGVDSALAAASRMAGVATTAIFVADIGAQPWVVVFGLGAVGNLAAQAFAIKGCRVIGVDPVASRRQLAERCGIPYTVGGSGDQVQDAIYELSQGELVDISVDAVGHSAVVQQALMATAAHGQVVLLGTPRVEVQGDLTTVLADIHLRFITVRGALEWCLPMYSPGGTEPSQEGKQQMIFDWLQRGLLVLEPLISHRLSPDKIKDAYDGLEYQIDRYTGVVLEW